MSPVISRDGPPASTYPRANFHYRQMNGSSTQSSLVRASDGRLYIIKPSRNLIAFREAFGYSLARSLQLPVPNWSPIVVTHEFIQSNPSFCHTGVNGEVVTPEPGLYFGSRLVSSINDTMLDEVPKSLVDRVRGRRRFYGVLALDIWANNGDARQAVFVSKPGRRAIDVVFIDFERCFGPGRATRRIDHQLYHLRNVYPVDRYVGRCMKLWERKMLKYDESRLRSLAEGIPQEWYSEGLLIRVIADLLTRRERMPGYIAQATQLLSLPSQRKPELLPDCTLRTSFESVL